VNPQLKGVADRLTLLARRVFKGIRLSDPDETTVKTIGRWLDNGPRTERQAREFVYLRAARGTWDGGSKKWQPWKGSLHRLFDETRWYAERHEKPDLERTYEHLKREFTEAWPTWLREIMEELGDAENGRAVAPREATGAADAEGPLRFGLGLRPASIHRG